MRRFFQIGLAAALTLTVAQGQEESFDELLQQFLNDDGLPRTGEIVDTMLQDRGELKRAIRSRLNREASGGEMYNLGVLANTIDEDDFEHFVWKAAAEKAVESPVDWWSMGKILASFVDVARPGDEELLEKIAQIEVESAPKLPEFARRKINSFEADAEASYIDINPPENRNVEKPDSPKERMAKPKVSDGSRLSVFGIAIGAVALVGIVLVLLRSRKGNSGR